MLSANICGFTFAWQIVTKRNRSLTLNLHSRNGPGGSRNLGTLTVHAEENFSSRMAVEMKLRCSQLDNKDMFSKSVCTHDASRFGLFICVYVFELSSYSLLLIGSFLENFKTTWKWKFCPNMQDRGDKQQFISSLETLISEHATVWKQGKLVISLWFLW